MAVLVKITRSTTAPPYTAIDIIKALRTIYSMGLWEAKCAYEEGIVFLDDKYASELEALHRALWAHIPNWQKAALSYTLTFGYEMPPRQAMPQRVGW